MLPMMNHVQWKVLLVIIIGGIINVMSTVATISNNIHNRRNVQQRDNTAFIPTCTTTTTNTRMIVPSQIIHKKEDLSKIKLLQQRNPIDDTQNSKVMKSNSILDVKLEKQNISKDIVTTETMTVNTTTTNITNNNNDYRDKTATQQQQQKQSFRYAPTGDLPDIYWRAIPLSHLRSHPNFIPLPHPDTIIKLNSLDDVKYFRQSSWQWDALHNGRCTSSQAAPSLGFLESTTAKILNIPRSLQNGSLGAYHRLRKPALRTLEDMNHALCKDGNVGSDNHNCEEDDDDIIQTINGRKLWRKMTTPYPFAAKYQFKIGQNEKEQHKMMIRRQLSQIKSPMAVRMLWGNTQEATAILTALNYFSEIDPGVKIREIGMCGAGLASNSTSSNDGLLIGASPDAIIEYSNGTIEVLEVKNHCPFVTPPWDNRSTTHNSNKKKQSNKFMIRDLPLQSYIPPTYVPQLMLEMLALGSECKSAIMVRQTATIGAIILRIHRDEEWIAEMIFWLEKFYNNYVKKNVVPPKNAFWNYGNDSKRYKDFVLKTKYISENVELVAHVPHKSIQRVLGDQGVKLPLFLDEI